jgi:hypothetical protein
MTLNRALALLFALGILLQSCASPSQKAPVPTESWPQERLRGANVVNEVTDADLKVLALDWKANSVRLIDFQLVSDQAPYALNEKRLEHDFELIETSQKLGLFVIFGPGVSMDNHDAFFRSHAFRASYKDFWKKVATHFKGRNLRLAYDLTNEPHDSAATREWRDYAEELARAIHGIDPFPTLVVEPAEWGWPKGFESLKPLSDKNVVYSFHFYGPMDFTHLRGYDPHGKFTGMLKATEKQRQERHYPGFIQGETWNKDKLERELSSAFAFQERYKVRLWCGEFGAARWAVGARQWYQDMIDILERHHLGWAYYSFREWHAMDIEMDPAVVGQPSPRSETDLVRLFKNYFSAAYAPGDQRTAPQR